MNIDLKKLLNYTDEQKMEHLNKLQLTELGKKDMFDNWKQRIQETYRHLKETEARLENLRNRR